MRTLKDYERAVCLSPISVTALFTLQRGYRLPALGGKPEFAEAGVLMTHGVNPALWRSRIAVYIDKILMGTKPADLPVELPAKFKLVISLKNAKALGLTIPPSLLLRAIE